MRTAALAVGLVVLASCSGGGGGSAASSAGGPGSIPVPPEARASFCRAKSQYATALATSPPRLDLYDLAANSFHDAADAITSTAPGEVQAKMQFLALTAATKLVEIKASHGDPTVDDARQKHADILGKVAADC